MLLEDHSDFLSCFADTLEPGRRKLSNSNVIEAKRPQDTEKKQKGQEVCGCIYSKDLSEV